MFRAILLIAALALLASPAVAGVLEDARAEIWAKEQAIYQGRAKGDFGVYVGAIAEGYLAWPPGRPAPIGPEGLNRDAGALVGQTREQLTMELVDFSLNGDAAVIYYRNHRTMRPDGTPVDEVFENIHVWLREAGAWRLFSGMSRPAASNIR